MIASHPPAMKAYATILTRNLHAARTTEFRVGNRSEGRPRCQQADTMAFCPSPVRAKLLRRADYRVAKFQQSLHRVLVSGDGLNALDSRGLTVKSRWIFRLWSDRSWRAKRTFASTTPATAIILREYSDALTVGLEYHQRARVGAMRCAKHDFPGGSSASIFAAICGSKMPFRL